MNAESMDLASALSGFDPAASAATLPSIVGVALACGLVLWLLGSKVLRPAAAVLGGALGSALGVIAPTSLRIYEVGGVPASLVGLGAGAVLGMLIALALYRAVLTFSTGVVFGTAGLIVSLAVYGSPAPVMETPDPAQPTAQIGDVSYVEAARLVLQDDPGGQEDSGSIGKAVQEQALAFVGATGDAIGEYWDHMPQQNRLIVLGSTLGSLMFGLILGLAAPQRASAVVTASLGSGLWLYCFAWLSISEQAPWAGHLDLGARGWAIAWAIAAAVGFAAQVLLFSKPKKSHEPAEAAA